MDMSCLTAHVKRVSYNSREINNCLMGIWHFASNQSTRSLLVLYFLQPLYQQNVMLQAAPIVLTGEPSVLGVGISLNSLRISSANVYLPILLALLSVRKIVNSGMHGKVFIFIFRSSDSSAVAAGSYNYGGRNNIAMLAMSIYNI